MATKKKEKGHTGGRGAPGRSGRVSDRGRSDLRAELGTKTEESGFHVAEFIQRRKDIIEGLGRFDGFREVPEMWDLYRGFITANMRHSKGHWAGQAFEPLPWQESLMRPLFSMVDCDGNRQYRKLLAWIPKKNGKSQLASVLGTAVFSEAWGQDVFSVATSQDQASLVHGEAIRTIENSPELNRVCRINRTTKVITLEGTQSYYKALSSDAGGAEGINPACLICDELHRWKGHDLWQTLMYGMAARRNALLVVISTAGIYDPESVGYQQYQLAKDILSGEVEDDRTLAFVAEAADHDDWTDPATWRKANPSYGVTIEEEEMRSAQAEAVRIPRYESAFRRYRLNQWVTSEETWIPGPLWDSCGGEVAPEDGEICYGGLDLASERDLAALVLVFPGEDVRVLQWLWTPLKGLEKRENAHRVPYTSWLKQGHLIGMSGGRIDQRAIKSKIQELADQYQIQEIAFDPWNSAQMAVEIEEEAKIEMVKFSQKATHFNEPMKYMEQLILEKRLVHTGNPVMSWNLRSVTPVTNHADHVMPSRANTSVKIDGIISLLMALSRVMLSDRVGSVYDHTDVTLL